MIQTCKACPESERLRADSICQGCRLPFASAEAKVFSMCHCSERRRRDSASKTTWWSALFGKKGWLSFLTQTQLCPVIWAIVLGLMAMFFFKVGARVQP